MPWNELGDRALVVGGVQITNVNPESQRDRHDEEAVRFEDCKDLVIACGTGPADQSYCEEVDGRGGVLSTPTPPNRLEYYPTQPELMRGG